MIAFKIIGYAIVSLVVALAIFVTIGCAIALLGGYNNETKDKEE